METAAIVLPPDAERLLGRFQVNGKGYSEGFCQVSIIRYYNNIWCSGCRFTWGHEEEFVLSVRAPNSKHTINGLGLRVYIYIYITSCTPGRRFELPALRRPRRAM